MSNFVICKGPLVIFGFIKPDDPVDAHLLENVDVLTRVMTKSLLLVSFFNWTHEGNESVWNNPIQVSIFDLFIMLVFLHIESSEVIPTKLDGPLETLETVK